MDALPDEILAHICTYTMSPLALGLASRRCELACLAAAYSRFSALQVRETIISVTPWRCETAYPEPNIVFADDSPGARNPAEDDTPGAESASHDSPDNEPTASKYGEHFRAETASSENEWHFWYLRRIDSPDALVRYLRDFRQRSPENSAKYLLARTVTQILEREFPEVRTRVGSAEEAALVKEITERAYDFVMPDLPLHLQFLRHFTAESLLRAAILEFDNYECEGTHRVYILELFHRGHECIPDEFALAALSICRNAELHPPKKFMERVHRITANITTLAEYQKSENCHWFTALPVANSDAIPITLLIRMKLLRKDALHEMLTKFAAASLGREIPRDNMHALLYVLRSSASWKLEIRRSDDKFHAVFGKLAPLWGFDGHYNIS